MRRDLLVQLVAELVQPGAVLLALAQQQPVERRRAKLPREVQAD